MDESFYQKVQNGEPRAECLHGNQYHSISGGRLLDFACTFCQGDHPSQRMMETLKTFIPHAASRSQCLRDHVKLISQPLSTWVHGLAMHYSISCKTRLKEKQNCHSYACFRQPEVRELAAGRKSHPIHSLFWPKMVQLDGKCCLNDI